MKAPQSGRYKSSITSSVEIKSREEDDFHRIPKRAARYDRWNVEHQNVPYPDMSIPYAAGSLYSTVEDLALWDQVLYNDKLLSASLKAILTTPYKSDYAYHLGVYKTQVALSQDSVEVMGHQGGANGFHTSLIRIPKNKHLGILLNNTSGTKLANQLRDGQNMGSPLQYIIVATHL